MPPDTFTHLLTQPHCSRFAGLSRMLGAADTPDPVTRLNAALQGRHRIEREIGEGGMATVYLADDLKHERSPLNAHLAIPT